MGKNTVDELDATGTANVTDDNNSASSNIVFKNTSAIGTNRNIKDAYSVLLDGQYYNVYYSQSGGTRVTSSEGTGNMTINGPTADRALAAVNKYIATGGVHTGMQNGYVDSSFYGNNYADSRYAIQSSSGEIYNVYCKDGKITKITDSSGNSVTRGSGVGEVTKIVNSYMSSTTTPNDTTNAATPNKIISIDPSVSTTLSGTSIFGKRDLSVDEFYDNDNLSLRQKWGDFESYQEGRLTITGESAADSFEINVDNVYDAVLRLRTMASKYESEQAAFCQKPTLAAEDILDITGNGWVNTFDMYIDVAEKMEELANNLEHAGEMIDNYVTNGGSLNDIKSFMRDSFNLQVDIDSDTPFDAPEGGPSYVPEPDNSNDDNISNVDTDIDTDVDVEPVSDSEPSTMPRITTSIGGAGIGSTLLGMATGAAGVAGAGALIDGDSVLDELGEDTIITPSTIRNSATTSIRKSKKDKVGAAVGVGVAAAAAGAGLYYYSKKAEEEENGEEEINEEDAEKVILQDDNEDGAVEFQYVSGLGNVVELKDAIMNDTL